MTAPAEDPRGGDWGLRDLLVDRLVSSVGVQMPPGHTWRPDTVADAVLALPAVVALLDAQAAVERVRKLCDVAEQQPDGYHFVATHLLRRALDGPS